MIKEHQIFYVHAGEKYTDPPVVTVAAAKLNEFSKKGWYAISVSTTEKGKVLLLCSKRYRIK